MQSIVIGTAGHIDHGKTSLVKAMTGIDTDRLKEEKARGITIELGFAHLDLGDGQKASIVDVPGHERFIKNMVAGTSGIDLVMMVVAADEGIMPQTREHLDICHLLGIDKGLVALTKIDMVSDPEWLDLVKQEMKAELAGTFLEDSPVVEVSSKTGAGLENLTAALKVLAQDVGKRLVDAPAFLAIDRVFTMKGFGTVTTGTLVAGVLQVEDPVDVLPDPRQRLRGMKIRGLQVHGLATQRAEAGQRLAVNLSGVDKSALSRGQVMVQKNTLDTGYEFEGSLELVRGAKALRSRSKAIFHVGTAKSNVAIKLLDVDTLATGAKAYARFRCEEPLAASPGQRYILRGFAPIAGRGTTLGGGKILAILPPRRRHKEREARVAELTTLEHGTDAERLKILLDLADVEGANLASLSMFSGLGRKTVAREMDKLMAQGQALKYDRDQGRYVAHATLDRLQKDGTEILTAFHQENPLLPGMQLEPVRAKLAHSLNPKLFKLLIDRQSKASLWLQEGETLRLTSHRIQLDASKSELEQSIDRQYQKTALTPPKLAELAKTVDHPEAGVLEIIRHLTRTGSLTHITQDMYVNTDALDQLRQQLIAHLRSQAEITTQEFKAMVGASRKHVIPLAEFFDQEKTTIRKGQARVLRRRDRELS